MSALVAGITLPSIVGNVDIDSISPDAKFDSNTSPTTIEYSKKFKRQEEINKKLKDKIDEEKLFKNLKKEKISLQIEKIKAKKDALKKSQEEENLLEEYKKQKEEFKNEKKQIELNKIKNKFDTARSKFKDEYTNSDGKVYIIPKYSCIEKDESGKFILKFLLDERTKKASWLQLSRRDIKDKDWMSLIDSELETKFQLDKKDKKDDEKDENAKIHFSLLNEYSLIQLKNPQPAPSQSKPSEPTSPQSTVEKKTPEK